MARRRKKREPKQHKLWPEQPKVPLSWSPRPGYRLPRCAICGKPEANIWLPEYDGKPVHSHCLDGKYPEMQ